MNGIFVKMEKLFPLMSLDTNNIANLREVWEV